DRRRRGGRQREAMPLERGQRPSVATSNCVGRRCASEYFTVRGSTADEIRFPVNAVDAETGLSAENALLYSPRRNRGGLFRPGTRRVAWRRRLLAVVALFPVIDR